MRHLHVRWIERQRASQSTPPRTRTGNSQILSPVPLPIGPAGLSRRLHRPHRLRQRNPSRCKSFPSRCSLTCGGSRCSSACGPSSWGGRSHRPDATCAACRKHLPRTGPLPCPSHPHLRHPKTMSERCAGSLGEACPHEKARSSPGPEGWPESEGLPELAPSYDGGASREEER